LHTSKINSAVRSELVSLPLAGFCLSSSARAREQLGIAANASASHRMVVVVERNLPFCEKAAIQPAVGSLCIANALTSRIDESYRRSQETIYANLREAIPPRGNFSEFLDKLDES
jgi:hypothetical protein